MPSTHLTAQTLATIQTLDTERDTLKTRVKMLEREIVEHRSALKRLSSQAGYFDCEEQIEALKNLCCEKFRMVLDMEHRRRMIAGEIATLRASTEKPARRYRTRAPRAYVRGKLRLDPRF